MNVGATEFNPDVQTPGITFTSLNLTTFSLFDTHIFNKVLFTDPEEVVCVEPLYVWGKSQALGQSDGSQRKS